MTCADAGVPGHHLWDIAATAVFLEHLLWREAERPGECVVEGLSHWAASLLRDAFPAIRRELHAHGVRVGHRTGLRAEQTCCVRRADAPETPMTPEQLGQLLTDVCAELNDLEVEWLPLLASTVSDIAEVLRDLMGHWLDVSSLRDLKVQHSVMFNEEWSTPYEVCWQADGAGNCIVMPDVGRFQERHFQHFAERMGHQCRGQTLLYQYLATVLIPCHEVLHIVQHLHGQMLDADPRSYAMEHDASRLNYVLMWHVLQRGDRRPVWAKWVFMLEGINRALWAQHTLSKGSGPSVYEAYRRWADSFGLESPEATFAANGDAAALALEGAVKILVSGEALTVGDVPPTRDHLRALLRTAFDLERTGDVYSKENRQRTDALLPPELRLHERAGGGLLAPPQDGSLSKELAAVLKAGEVEEEAGSF